MALVNFYTYLAAVLIFLQIARISQTLSGPLGDPPGPLQGPSFGKWFIFLCKTSASVVATMTHQHARFQCNDCNAVVALRLLQCDDCKARQDHTRPGQTRPGKVTPGQTRPGKATRGQTTSKAKPGQTRPGKATPGQTRPGKGTPSQINPGKATPGRQNRLDQTRPGQTRPGQTKPGQPIPQCKSPNGGGGCPPRRGLQ